jgi:Alpha/beta hydrolase domain
LSVRRLLFLLLAAIAARGAVVRVEVADRTSAANYDRIAGRVYFAVDPALAVNRAIVDLEKAPRNSDGLVEFSADLLLLKPKNPNGTILLDIPNRGNRPAVGAFSEDFLMERGYTVAWIGWQFDVPDAANLLRLYAPLAKGVRGLVRAEIVADQREVRHSVADRNHRPYPILNPDDPALTLTVRDHVDAPRQTVPRAAWHIENADTVVMTEGFDPGRLYELVYTSQDPPVAGLGFAAARDLVSYLKYGTAYGELKRAIAFGVSQSGRYLRTYLYYGFNQDEKGRKVLDGVMANVAGAGRGSFNQRFAQPSRDGHPFLNTLYPSDLFPFTDLEERDPVSGMKDGLLTHALKPEFRPRIFYTNSSYEYYGRDAGLIHVTPDGKGDAALAADTRVYTFAGGQHGAAAFPPRMNHTQNLNNPNPYNLCFRALLTAMNAWIKDGTAPPASVYPKIGDGQLVPLASVHFPKIPGVAFPAYITLARREDYGPEFRMKGIATIEPPKLGTPFPAMVPQVDGDGNDLGGIRTPELAVPLATYTGWNLRAKENGAPDELASMQGSWIPFARTKAERERTGDPRLSMEERYASREEYLKRFVEAAKSLERAGFLLPADAARIVERGAVEWDYLHR